MFNHIAVGTNDFERDTEFYDAVMVVPGHACFISGEGYRGYGQHYDIQFWVLTPFDKDDLGLRPHYHPNYYGACVRDPDGNKLQAICHHAED